MSIPVNLPISLIVAYDIHKGIGRDGGIPWHIPNDLKRFRLITMGKTVIMGRKTWDSLPIKPLPGRHNIVISQSMTPLKGVEVAHSMEEAIHLAENVGREIMIIGGETLYRQFLPLATTMFITEVAIDGLNCTAHFPSWDSTLWEMTAREELSHDDISYKNETWERKGKYMNV